MRYQENADLQSLVAGSSLVKVILAILKGRGVVTRSSALSSVFNTFAKNLSLRQPESWRLRGAVRTHWPYVMKPVTWLYTNICITTSSHIRLGHPPFPDILSCTRDKKCAHKSG